MTMTLPYRRQQVTPRSGGRVAGDRRAAIEREDGSGRDRRTDGALALAPEETTGRSGRARRAPDQQSGRAAGRRADQAGVGGRRAEQVGATGLRVDRAATAAVRRAQPVAPGGRRVEPADRPTLPRLRVAPPAPVTVARAPFVAMMLVVVIAGVVGILVLNTKINENAFRLDALQRNGQVLDRKEDAMNRELANVESPGSLAAAARRLGLVPADRPAFIKLPDGTVLGVPKPASAAGQPRG
jgi:hypothetical protein